MSITDAAIYWWESKRPSSWDLERHLGWPRVNCTTEAEMELAAAVANKIRMKTGKGLPK